MFGPLTVEESEKDFFKNRTFGSKVPPRLEEKKVQEIFGRLTIRCHKPMKAKKSTFYFAFSGLDFPFVYWRQARHQKKIYQMSDTLP